MKVDYFDWILFTIRFSIGVILTAHGVCKILEEVGYRGIGGILLCKNGGIMLLTPITEIIGGGLMLTGVIIELGTFLIISLMIFFLLIKNLNNNCIPPILSPHFIINLIMLVVVVGICGPGKLALWDPGKSFRNKRLEKID